MNLLCESFDAIIKHDKYFEPLQRGDLVEVRVTYSEIDDMVVRCYYRPMCVAISFTFTHKIDLNDIFTILPRGYDPKTVKVLYGY